MKSPYKKALCASAVALCLTASGQSFAINPGGSADAGTSTTPRLAQFRPALSNRGIPNQYIVVLKTQPGFSEQSSYERESLVSSMAYDIANTIGGRVTHQYAHAINGFVVQMNADQIRTLRQDPRVESIEQDQMMHANTTQSGATWGIDRIDQVSLPLSGSYTYTDDGTGVHAYIIDTGTMISHSQFGGRAINGWDFVDNDSVANDCNGHGTHVSGTVGSTTYGVAKNVSLTAVRVLDCQGSGSNSGVIAGIDWVAQNAVLPAVANMSLGGGDSAALDSAVNNAINAGVTFAVAAGNSNTDACSGSPNKVPAAITVASSTNTDARSSFSSWGSCIDIFAPGSNITSTWNDGSTNTISGTSMASPHVAGAAAVYLQSHPSDTPAQVTTALKAAASVNKISSPNGSPNLLLNINFGGGTTPPPPTGGTLSNGVAVTGLAAATGADLNYTMAVPSGATGLSFNLSGGTGDADMYVKFGSAPTLSSYDCRPYVSGNSESCPVGTAQTGTYYVMVHGYAAFSGVSLIGAYTDGGTTPPPTGGTLSNGVSVTGLAAATGADLNYTMAVPSGATGLSFNLSGGTGDADMYVKFGSAPTLSSYDCRPYVSGNSESCPVGTAQTGTYYVMVHGYAAFSGVSLIGAYTDGGTTPPPTGGTFTNGTNVTISDNATATSNLVVSRTGDSGTISVHVDIIHTYVGDLKLSLISPSGVSTVLRNRTGGSANDIHDNYSVNASGTASNGTWKLRVQDLASGDVGYIDSWSITF